MGVENATSAPIHRAWLHSEAGRPAPPCECGRAAANAVPAPLAATIGAASLGPAGNRIRKALKEARQWILSIVSVPGLGA